MGRYDHSIRLFVDNDTYADMGEVKSLLARYTGDTVTNAEMIHMTMALVKGLEKEGKLKQYINDMKASGRKVDWG